MNKFLQFLKNIKAKIKSLFTGKVESEIGKIGEKLVKEYDHALDLFVEGIRNASDNLAYAKNTTGEGVVKKSSRDIEIVDVTGVEPATEAESISLDLLDARNLARYYNDVTSILNNKMSSNRLLLIGKPSEILQKYLGSSNPLYMPQSIVKKVVFDKVNGGKHGLGRIVIDDLPYQFTNPLAITGNTSQHQQDDYDSIVVWTDWQTEEGYAIIVPVRIDIDGQVGFYNNVNSVFDVNNQDYFDDLLRNGNVLYTENNRDIHELLDAQGRKVPKSQATNVSMDMIAHPKENINTSDKNNNGMGQSRDADYLSAVKRGDMQTSQRMVDEVARAAGYSVKAYHGTNADFTVFDRSRSGENTGNEGFLGRGLYFSSSERDASSYGKNTMPVYLKMENTIDFDNDDWVYNLGIKSRSEAQRVTHTKVFPERNGFYTIAYQTDNSGGKWDYIYNRTVHQIGTDNGKSYIEKTIRDQILPRDIKSLSDLIIEHGYDSAKGSGTNFGDTGTEYVVYNPLQVKSADPVTYDDNGDVIPLSERFNSEKSDIRYQERESWDDLLWDDISEDSTDTELIRHHLTMNHEAIGEILSRTGDVKLAQSDLRRNAKAALSKYGFSSKAAQRITEALETVMKDTESGIEMSGEDILADIGDAV